MTRRVLIVVTHLLGAGHLTRAASLARAFAARGYETTLVSGGGAPSPLIPLGQVKLVQLPPLHVAGTDFKGPLDGTGVPASPDYFDRRRSLLLEALAKARPDVVITELFPFGRRVLADEFLALLDAACAMTPRPVIACSIRDILVAPVRPDRVAQAHERIARYYDVVLVHGDPRLAPLEASWPVDEGLRPYLRYTGYVDDGSSNPQASIGAQRNGIVVSGGSSGAALPLFWAAIEAARQAHDRPWRILVGNGLPDAAFDALRASAAPHVTVERARPDFRELLREAEISVSQAGYNTAVDLLRTGVGAVLVPFEEGRETEQRLRAERFAAAGLAQVIPAAQLTPDRLLAAIRHSKAAASPPSRLPSLDGAKQSVASIEKFLDAAPARLNSLDWSPLDGALQRARDEGVAVNFWWRDDDAICSTRSAAAASRPRAPPRFAAFARRDPGPLRTLASRRTHRREARRCARPWFRTCEPFAAWREEGRVRAASSLARIGARRRGGPRRRIREARTDARSGLCAALEPYRPANLPARSARRGFAACRPSATEAPASASPGLSR